MPKASGTKGAEPNAHLLGLVVAQEELGILEKLAAGVVSKIKDFAKTRRFDGEIDSTEFALHQRNYAQLKAYEELAHACYGRTVVGTAIDEKDRPKGAFTYRITQANIGYIDGKCVVLARNSPLATALVTALPTESREVTTRNQDRFLTVDEVRIFDGPVSLLSHTQAPNFRSAAVRNADTKRPVVLRDLRSILSRAAPPHVIPTLPKADVAREADLGWLFDWSDVYLPETDETSLGHQFFIQTTLDQERALNNPHGITFVEGIAGSGKTSVALGRLKFFANFAVGERQHYGLQNAPEGDFSPANMVGFVLSPSLKRYLKDTASMLGLERLPIRDFEEFRIDMSGFFLISERFKRKKNNGAPTRSRINWLRALDAAMARAAATKIRESLRNVADVPPLVATNVDQIIRRLLQSQPDRDSNVFNLRGLAERLVDIVADAELRTREKKIRDEFKIRQSVEDERYRREKASLEREMRSLQQQSEKRIISPLMHVLLSDVAAHDLISAAVDLEEFPNLVSMAFGRPIDVELGDAISDFRQILAAGGSRPALADADFVNLVILAAMIAEGFEYLDQRNELPHLKQMRSCTAVFIDEVQDFAENEIMLMGMTASTSYHQITLSGDRKQRLQDNGAEVYDYLFPGVPKSHQNKPFFLDHNFRQRRELAFFSSGFRSLVQNDSAVPFQPDQLPTPLSLYKYAAPERMGAFIEERIRALPRNATIAIITPTVADAEFWYKLLEDELASGHRPPRLSHRDDLTRRLNVHFTEARETKGLEFDVVMIPDLGAFSLNSEIGRNQAYVAISRPRHSIILGCRNESASKPELEMLVRSNLVRMTELTVN